MLFIHSKMALEFHLFARETGIELRMVSSQGFSPGPSLLERSQLRLKIQLTSANFTVHMRNDRIQVILLSLSLLLSIKIKNTYGTEKADDTFFQKS